MATKINPSDFKIKIDSLYSYFERGKALFGDHTLYRFNKNKDEEVSVSYKEMYNLITDIALAFKKLGMAGKKVILLGETSVQWISSYIATVAADGVIVPIDPLLLEEQIIEFTKFAEASFVVCSHKFEHIFKEHEAEIPNVEMVISTDRTTFTLDPEQEYVEEKFTTYNNVLALGRYLEKNTELKLDTRNHDTKKLGILLFTSGTTGSSKGVMLCERNVCAVLEGIYPFLAGLTKEDSVMSVLPIYHTYEMSAGILAPMLYGMTISISDGIKYVGKNIKQFKPTVMALVPLFANQLYKTIQKNVQKQGKEKTLATGIKISNMLLKLHIDARKKLFGEVLQGLGGNMKAFIVGGAALNPQIAEGFENFGIKVRQGYGITECAPLISVIPLHEKNNPASCGKLMPGMQIYIDKEKPEDSFGEIVVKGDNVMLGYYKNEEETAKVLSNDGWFKTGDYGYIDDDGYIYITGRKKNVIVLQGGKNVFPEEIEEYLENVSVIEEVVVVGDENKETGVVSVVALVYPNHDECEKLGLLEKKDIEAYLHEEIQKINKRLASYKHITRVELRDEPFEKTTSRKIKRHAIKKD